MLRSLARVLLVSAFAVAAAVPMTASAAGGGGGGGSNGMTISVGSPVSLQNRLLVSVPVTVSCVAPIAIDPTITFPGSISVTIQQAAGKSVSTGFGGVELDSCSPTPQTFVIQVTPSPGPAAASPFHGGPAIASASGAICDNNYPQTCYWASTPWAAIKL